MQAIQTMQKIIDPEDPAVEDNIRVLQMLRDDEETGDAVRVQIIQTLHKLILLVEGEPKKDNIPTEDSIMDKIRSAKK